MAMESATLSLDAGTLFVIAIVIASLLGLFLLFAWTQERNQALAWWGGAYLIGAASGALWRFGSMVAPALPASFATALLFVAIGMLWSGSRLFHGRPIRWVGMLFGAGFWLIACFVPAFALSASSRVVVSSIFVAGYTFLTANELRQERRKSVIRHWPAAFVPMLHGAIFLLPGALVTLAGEGGMHAIARSWIAVFAIEIVLYVIGAAFIVLILAKDRAVHLYRTAATTDPLTGLLNRRGFFEAAAILMGGTADAPSRVSVLAFDLDHFKSINDRYGHNVGDAVLQMFARVARDTLRAGDLVGRLGGEEFVALLPGTLAEAGIAAERVRSALAAEHLVHGGQLIAATVSIGIASAPPSEVIDTIITRADAALYRAKAAGRNRVEAADECFAPAPERQRDLRATRAAQKAQRAKEKGVASDDALEGCLAG